MSAELPLSGFRVDKGKCTGCGLCAADCALHIIEMENSVPVMKPENDAECLACQHCLAVCPAAAVSVAGKNPAGSRPVETVDAAAIERAIFARRSVRQFAPGVVDDETIRRALTVAAHAPTAVNARDLRFTVVSGLDAMADLRRRSCERLVEMGDAIPEDTRWIVDVARDWLNGGHDGIFRDAPHIIVVTGGKNQVHTVVDSTIALAYFELHANGLGVGTTWCGMFASVLRAVPEAKTWLGIPADHEIGYTMLFGKKGVDYARSAQHAADVRIVKGLS